MNIDSAALHSCPLEEEVGLSIYAGYERLCKLVLNDLEHSPAPSATDDDVSSAVSDLRALYLRDAIEVAGKNRSNSICADSDGRRYDTEHFISEYGVPTQTFGEALTVRRIASLRSLAIYIYVSLASGDLIVSIDPLSTQEAILGNKYKRFTHAHLAFERGVGVQCAGEVIFIRSSCCPVERVDACIINNVSGHFRCVEDELLQARHAFARMLGLPLKAIVLVGFPPVPPGT
jgi:hypothetical protein